MEITEDTLPDCFGDLEKVFPKGQDDLRITPKSCITKCKLKTECLKQALKGKTGLKVQEECVDRAYESGVISFFERWSKKKYLKKQKNNE